MDILNNEPLWHTLNGTNGVLVLFVIFVIISGFGIWQVIQFTILSIKELAMTLNQTLQEIKKEISNLSSKIEEVSNLPYMVSDIDDRLQVVESQSSPKSQNKRRSRR